MKYKRNWMRRWRKCIWGSELETLEKEIDKLVYELYGLTEEEIRIVEGEL